MLLALVLAGIATWPVQVRAADASPATTAEAVRAALFDAQSALLSGDTASAQARATDAATASEPLLTALPADSVAAQRIADGLVAASQAAATGDATALASARGEIATAILLGSYDAT